MITRFLSKYYLLVAAIVATILFTSYYSQTYSTNYSSAVSQFESNLHKMEYKLESALETKKNELLDEGLEHQWIEGSVSENIHIHVYRNDSLIYWNTNQLPITRFADIHFPSGGLLHLQNGWYYAKVKKAGDYLISASFLIKQDFAYENSDLINNFMPMFELPFTAQISLEEEAEYPIYSKNKEFVCSVVPDETQKATKDESIVMMFLLLLSVFVWLFWFSQIEKRIKQWNWLIPISVIGLRVLSIKYNWLSFMGETEVFDPGLYGTNNLFPNFFEYLLNIGVIVYVMYSVNHRLSRLKRSVFAKMLSAFLLLISIGLWPLMLYLTHGLIEDSTIPLAIDELFSLNIYSILAVTSLGVFFYAYFQVLKGILASCVKQDWRASQLSVACFAISVGYFFYEINLGYEQLFAGLFPLFYMGIALYLVFKNKGVQQLATGLILLFGFAMVMSLTIGDFGRDKQRGETELYANQLATEKDIVTEVEYSLLSQELKEDNFLSRFIADPTFISVSDFQENLERRLFNDFWERYEMSFYFFDEQNEALIDKDNEKNTYAAIQGIVDSSGVASEIDPNIYFITDYTGQYSYIIRQELSGKDSTKATLFCTLKSKKIPEEIGFPRLLISGSANVFSSLETYSIARYHNKQLVTKYGSFNYPSSYMKMKPENFQGKGFFDFGGFNHYMLRKTNQDVIVLSSKNVTNLDVLTSFSYLFSFYGLLLLPLLFRMNSNRVFKRTLSLAMKIQIVLISLVFLSLLAFGWGSGIFVSSQYNQYTNDVIREKLSSVETEVRAKLGKYDELSIIENGNYMQRILQKFSKVFFTDINLYDANGYILASSRPKVFNIGLISENMNPEAYENMRYGQKSEFVHYENIGALSYSSAYQPFYNNEGKKLAFINLQHFGQQSEFENQIEKFLVAIINVFILLLAVSIILAIFISNWLTAPLRLLQESFSAVKFGTHNEPISYNKEDEIGSLVKDYNQKLEELEFTAQQLARSERESAWREMAKQVAHEIKNPLTPMKLSVQQLLRVYNPDDPKSEQKLQRVANSIVEQIDALTKIANEFSSFAKMPVPSEERLELLALIKGVKEVFTMDDKAEIILKTPLDEVYVKADKNQIIRVFNNLIKNAIQAIPEDREGKITIEVDKNEKDVLIHIIDNGIGIERSKLAKIFVPYFTTKSTGTGLGLAMVKQMVENHHGTIDFETEMGVGTTFIITLPVSI